MFLGPERSRQDLSSNRNDIEEVEELFGALVIEKEGDHSKASVFEAAKNKKLEPNKNFIPNLTWRILFYNSS